MFVEEKREGFYYVPSAIQQGVLTTKSKEFYFKLPKSGTNSRGVEISKLALLECIAHKKHAKNSYFLGTHK
nr:ThaI family type II restriction endonuclease [Helicobacter pylori]